jgi:DNA-binding beta-propeller fold protein YncE
LLRKERASTKLSRNVLSAMTNLSGKETSMRKFLIHSLALQLVLAGLCLTLLLVGMNACSVFATNSSATQELPRLQAILPFPNTPAPSFVSVIPGGYAYVVTESGPILVLDGTQMIHTILLPAEDEFAVYFDGVTIHPQTQVGYLPNTAYDDLYVIQGTEMVTVLRNIGDLPRAVGINPNTGLVYAGYGLRERENITAGSMIAVIDGTSVITTLNTGIGYKTITPDPNSSKMFVGQDLIRRHPYQPQGMFAVLDGTTVVTVTNLNYEQEKPDSDGDINNIAVDPQSGEIYMIRNLGTVVYWHNNQIKPIYLSRMGYTGLHDLAIDPQRGLAYVSSWGDPASHVVVLQHGEVVTALPVGKDPRAVVYDETHDYVYVANRLGHSLSVIRNTEVITTIEARGNPWDIGVDEKRGYIYLANPDSHNITVFGFDQEADQLPFWQTFLPWLAD